MVRPLASLDAAVTAGLTDHPDDPVVAWVDATARYRAWAMANRADFSLVYGTPIRDYAAPEGRTRELGRSAGEPLFRIVVVALQKDLIDRASMAGAAASMSDVMREGVIADARRRGLEVPDDVAGSLVAASLAAWAELQGLVAMELLGHLSPVEAFAEEFFRRATAGIIRRVVPG